MTRKLPRWLMQRAPQLLQAVLVLVLLLVPSPTRLPAIAERRVKRAATEQGEPGGEITE